jgi:hypothetical protein
MATTTTLMRIGVPEVVAWARSRTGKIPSTINTRTNRLWSLLIKSPGLLICLIWLICFAARE